MNLNYPLFAEKFAFEIRPLPLPTYNRCRDNYLIVKMNNAPPRHCYHIPFHQVYQQASQ
jgi:hypothetical protein